MPRLCQHYFQFVLTSLLCSSRPERAWDPRQGSRYWSRYYQGLLGLLQVRCSPTRWMRCRFGTCRAVLLELGQHSSYQHVPQRPRETYSLSSSCGSVVCTWLVILDKNLRTQLLFFCQYYFDYKAKHCTPAAYYLLILRDGKEQAQFQVQRGQTYKTPQGRKRKRKRFRLIYYIFILLAK